MVKDNITADADMAARRLQTRSKGLPNAKGVITKSAPRKSKQSSMVRNIRRVMRDLLTGFGPDATLAQLEQRGRTIASKMSPNQKKLLEVDLQELRDAHGAGRIALHSLLFRWIEHLRPQQKRRQGVAAGPEDGRMFGISSADYQNTLQKLSEAELKRLHDAADALWQQDFDAFRRGWEATVNTAPHADSIAQLLALLGCAQRIRTGATEYDSCVIAVCNWDTGMLGRAARAACNNKVAPVAWFLGDCAAVDANLAKYRSAAKISRHCLRRVFTKLKLDKDSFSDNTRARQKLLKEAVREDVPPGVLIFVDARDLPLTSSDWAECKKVSQSLGAVILVSVKSAAHVEPGMSCVGEPAVASGRPRANLRRVQMGLPPVQSEPPQPQAPAAGSHERGMALLRDSRDLILDIIYNSDALQRRQLQAIDRLSREMAMYRSQLTWSEHRMLKTARTMVELGGPYVSDSEEEEDFE